MKKEMRNVVKIVIRMIVIHVMTIMLLAVIIITNVEPIPEVLPEDEVVGGKNQLELVMGDTIIDLGETNAEADEIENENKLETIGIDNVSVSFKSEPMVIFPEVVDIEVIDENEYDEEVEETENDFDECVETVETEDVVESEDDYDVYVEEETEEVEEAEYDSEEFEEDMEDEEETSYEEYSNYSLSEINRYSTTEERIHAIFDYLIEQGFTRASASGIIGNIAVESTFDPTTVSSDNSFYGICQWNTSADGEYWWQDVTAWLRENGYDEYSFEGQVRAIVECPRKGQVYDDFEQFKKETCVDAATEYFAVYYESCVGGSSSTIFYNAGTCYQGLDTRKSEAWIAYEMYNDYSMEYSGEKPYYCD